jgi:hypothetical protein
MCASLGRLSAIGPLSTKDLAAFAVENAQSERPGRRALPTTWRMGQVDPKRTPDVMQKSIRLCEIGWVDLRCPKFGRVLEVFGLARAPAVTSRRQKALRHFSQLGALNLCAVGPWRRREGFESDAARWSFESREVFGAMLAQRRLVERDAGA